MMLYTEYNFFKLSFIEPASPLMYGIVQLHDHIFFFLNMILFLVLFLLFSTIQLFTYDKNSLVNRYLLSQTASPRFEWIHLNSGTTLEVVWTVLPSLLLVFIAIPSFALLYATDELVDPSVTVQVVAHQWYRSYEYNDLAVIGRRKTLSLELARDVEKFLKTLSLTLGYDLRDSSDKEAFIWFIARDHIIYSLFGMKVWVWESYAKSFIDTLQLKSCYLMLSALYDLAIQHPHEYFPKLPSSSFPLEEYNLKLATSWMRPLSELSPYNVGLLPVPKKMSLEVVGRKLLPTHLNNDVFLDTLSKPLISSEVFGQLAFDALKNTLASTPSMSLALDTLRDMHLLPVSPDASDEQQTTTSVVASLDEFNKTLISMFLDDTSLNSLKEGIHPLTDASLDAFNNALISMFLDYAPLNSKALEASMTRDALDAFHKQAVSIASLYKPDVVAANPWLDNDVIFQKWSKWQIPSLYDECPCRPPALASPRNDALNGQATPIILPQNTFNEEPTVPRYDSVSTDVFKKLSPKFYDSFLPKNTFDEEPTVSWYDSVDISVLKKLSPKFYDSFLPLVSLEELRHKLSTVESQYDDSPLPPVVPEPTFPRFLPFLLGYDMRNPCEKEFFLWFIHNKNNLSYIMHPSYNSSTLLYSVGYPHYLAYITTPRLTSDSDISDYLELLTTKYNLARSDYLERRAQWGEREIAIAYRDQLMNDPYRSDYFGRMAQWGQIAGFHYCPAQLVGNIEFDSYLKQESDLLLGEPRLYETDFPLVLPKFTHIRFMITPDDVIHSWSVPALGIKVDAVPGRINHAHTFIKRSGIFYGQCSELCGVNHAFMPIQIIAFEPHMYYDYLRLVVLNK